MSSLPPLIERLGFLARITEKEARLLTFTHDRLFGDEPELTTHRVEEWTNNDLTAEQLDAFVARFGRLQDTLGDKLIPSLLEFLGEKRGPAIDNLDKAEKFGWITSTDSWLLCRQLRNQMIHEYIEDIKLLTDALQQGRMQVPHLIQASEKMLNEIQQRLNQ